MSDHDAFLRGILENPDDDSPRLVYADWLEERADLRAEFIRVQCELAKLPPDDPKWDALEQREWDLLRQHEAAWTADIKSLVTEWQFHRGFVDTISLGARAFVDHAEKLFQRAPIRHTTLTRLGTSSVAAKDLAACTQLARLRSLELNGELALADLRTLILSNHLQELGALALPGGRFPSDILQTLAKDGPPSLEELNLSGMSGTGRQLHLLTRFSLTKLSLAVSGLGPDDAQRVASAATLVSLTELDLSNNNMLRVAGAQALAQSPHLTKLKRLALGTGLDGGTWRSDLAGCQIGLRGTQALATSATFANLTALDLRDNNLADAAISAIVASPHWTKLRELRLGSNKVATKGIQALVQWPGLERLNLLDLWVNYGIADAGAKLLADSPRAANLVHLDLGYTTLTAKGVLPLAKSSHLTRLRFLNLEGNKIGDPGVKMLAKSPILAGLRCLNLCRTGLIDSGAKALADSPHLQHLRQLKLNGNKLKPTTRTALEERFGAGVCQFGLQ
jgi:uncharacterized protein (TIGR02996 family)